MPLTEKGLRVLLAGPLQAGNNIVIVKNQVDKDLRSLPALKLPPQELILYSYLRGKSTNMGKQHWNKSNLHAGEPGPNESAK